MSDIIASIFIGAMILLIMIAIIEYVQERLFYKKAILSKFPEAEKGFRMVKSKGTMDYVYTDGKLYEIIFSQLKPPAIVYTKELEEAEIKQIEEKIMREKNEQLTRRQY